ncbi:hypothetical protein V462_14290 [Pantoea ananatis 15320]|nr:hypothetical protein V462_14290 [Pantoea ananatis 15320]
MQKADQRLYVSLCCALSVKGTIALHSLFQQGLLSAKNGVETGRGDPVGDAGLKPRETV